MASIERQIEEVADPALRERLRTEVERLKRAQTFGIVYEEHSETAALPGLPIEVGALVERSDRRDGKVYEVAAMTHRGRQARLVDSEGSEATCDTLNLLVHKRLGEPIYPGLTPVGRIKRSKERPYHAVINGENFHALQDRKSVV